MIRDNNEESVGKIRDGNDVPVETLSALRAGEQWAYNEVYARFASPLKDFLTTLIRNEEDAKELNHDIFLSLWTGREKIIPEKGIKGFLYMRARNLAMNYFDHKKVKQKYVDFCERDTDYAFSPDLQLIGKETKILIELFLQGLSEQKRTIFKLRHELGHSVEEIAVQLGLSQSTIKNSLTLITKALRNAIAMYLAFCFQSIF